MKKLFLTLAATALCTTAFAGKVVLYQQNFETASDVAATGWTYGGDQISIASDEFGKFLQLYQGTQNGRSGYVQWGSEIFLDAEGNSVLEHGTYQVKFDICIAKNSTDQFNTEITLFTNNLGVTNQPYRQRWSGDIGPYNTFVFDAYQSNTDKTDADMTAAFYAPYQENVAEDGTVSYTLDLSDSYTLTTGSWLTVTCDIDVNTRTVEYSVMNIDGSELTSGSYTVPENNLGTAAESEPVSMYAEGIWVMTARYQTTIDFDNIEISYESDKDVANIPTVALTGIGVDPEEVLNLNYRKYTITFLDGETLHVTGTDGSTTDVEWADCDGAYVYGTATSGTLKAWTTSGTATSEAVEVQVECVPCELPEATAKISSVQAGYGKTYTLNVSNADVPLQPTIFIDYEFVGDNGEVISEEGVASGATVTVTQSGTLKLTSASYGYQSTTVNVKNNLEFAVKQEWDFARMSDEEIAAAGFTTWNVLNASNMSGFNNWTARKRLFYYDGTTYTDEEGNEKQTQVYPFGFVAEDNTTNVIDYSEIGVEGEDLGVNVEGYELFPGIRIFDGHNVSYMKHIGFYNNATGGRDSEKDAKDIDVLNLDQSDFVVANIISDYGGNSIHPVVATDAEYYAVLSGGDNVYSVAEVGTEVMEGEGETAIGTGVYTVSIPVHRIDAACTKVTVFKQLGDAVEGVEAEVAGDNYYYTIDGMRIAQPTQKGLYIHNGKKIIVK